jgi:hypothetical protein
MSIRIETGAGDTSVESPKAENQLFGASLRKSGT